MTEKQFKWANAWVYKLILLFFTLFKKRPLEISSTVFPDKSLWMLKRASLITRESVFWDAFTQVYRAEPYETNYHKNYLLRYVGRGLQKKIHCLKNAFNVYLVVAQLILVSTNICLQQSSHWCKCSEVCFLETQVLRYLHLHMFLSEVSK